MEKSNNSWVANGIGWMLNTIGILKAKEIPKEENVILNPIASTASAHGGPIKCMTTMIDHIS